MLFGMASYRTWLAYACIMHLIACHYVFGSCFHSAMLTDGHEIWFLRRATGWCWRLVRKDEKNRNQMDICWVFVLPNLSLHFPKFPSNTWYPNLAKSCKIKKSTDVSQASLLYIFQNDLVIVGEGRAVSAMQSFAKTLVHTGHVQYDEAIHIQLVGYFSLKSRHACTSIEECRSMLMLRCFALVWSRICSGVARISQCQQLVSWGGISWALESCIADLRWAGHCSLGTQIWEPGRTFAAWRKRLLAFAPFQLQYKAWSTF